MVTLDLDLVGFAAFCVLIDIGSEASLEQVERKEGSPTQGIQVRGKARRHEESSTYTPLIPDIPDNQNDKLKLAEVREATLQPQYNHNHEAIALIRVICRMSCSIQK